MTKKKIQAQIIYIDGVKCIVGEGIPCTAGYNFETCEAVVFADTEERAALAVRVAMARKEDAERAARAADEAERMMQK